MKQVTQFFLFFGRWEPDFNDKAEEVIRELFDSLKDRYQSNLESIKGSQFVFDYVHLLCYKWHKINPHRGGSYIDSLD